MQFSVVIPLFNKRATIARAIQSVLDQTEAFEELIVVDDGSTDGGDVEVRRFADPRIRLIAQPNAGEAAARNTGIAAATGTHVAFLDADDRWHAGFLAAIAKLARYHPEGWVYATGYEVAEPDNSATPALPGIGRFLSGKRLDYFAALARWRFPLSSSSICVPRARFDTVGCFDEGLKIGADIDMWVRLCLGGPAFFDATPLATYHKDADNRSNAQSDFWEKRLMFVQSLRRKLQGKTIARRDRANLCRHLSRVTYETLVAASDATGRPILDVPEMRGSLRPVDRARLAARRLLVALRRSAPR